MFAWVMPSYN
ncbi:hypothetical protein D049_4308, partial [Vibrio parahaemolyticus VPTS-2010]